jgi:hypothetical protein
MASFKEWPRFSERGRSRAVSVVVQCHRVQMLLSMPNTSNDTFPIAARHSRTPAIQIITH